MPPLWRKGGAVAGGARYPIQGRGVVCHRLRKENERRRFRKTCGSVNGNSEQKRRRQGNWFYRHQRKKVHEEKVNRARSRMADATQGKSAAARKVRKAVLPAAGLGTRFLPATKAQPKEMLNVVDKPQIQYVVEECVASGIEHIIIVTGRGKSSIEDHFDFSPELEHFLETKGKHEELAIVQNIGDMVQVSYTRQKEPLGLGHAVLVAKDLVGDEPFAVLLGDVLIPGENPATRQLAKVYESTGIGAIAVEEVPREKTNLYGIIGGEVSPEGPFGERLLRIREMVEKPKP